MHCRWVDGWPGCQNTWPLESGWTITSNTFKNSCTEHFIPNMFAGVLASIRAFQDRNLALLARMTFDEEYGALRRDTLMRGITGFTL